MQKLTVLSALCCVFLLTSFFGCDDEDTYLVRYNANNADLGSVPVDTEEYKDGDLVTVKGNEGNLRKDKHRFEGWIRVGSEDDIYQEGDTLLIDLANVVLKANWVKDDSVTLDVTYYTVRHMQQDTEGDSYTLVASERKKGEVDEKTEAVAKEYPGFTAQEFEQETIEEGNITVVEICYDRNLCALSYNANAGEEVLTLPVQESCRYGQTVTVNTDALSREGYTFFGWSTTQNEAFAETNTEAAAAATEYGVGVANTIKMTADTVLYAVWVAGTVEVPKQDTSASSSSATGETDEGGNEPVQVSYTVRHLQEDVTGGGVF